ncbi:MAG: DUF2259 domain-containing protein [Proteobacteria bacterium]|nr:MAG: DUF2259 domain-containing protein [Pseudomonadota bacterium]
MRILDMESDKYIFDRQLREESEEAPADYNKVLTTLKSDLDKLAAETIRSQGLVDLVKDPKFSKDNIALIKRFSPDDSAMTKSGKFTAFLQHYEFRLTNRLATETEVSKGLYTWCKEEGGPMLFDLTLRNFEAGTGDIVVHKDAKLPKSRYCALDYGVQEVYAIQGHHLLTFVRYKGTGFEGPDYRTITVPVWQAELSSGHYRP